MTPSTRWTQRLAAVFVLAIGVLALVLTARGAPPVHAEFLDFGYARQWVVGAHYVLLAVGLLQILTAASLWHGKRNAWRICVATSVALVVAAHVHIGDVVGLVGGVAQLALLLLTGKAFVAQSDPLRARQGWRVLLVGEVLVALYAFTGLYFFDQNLRHTTSLVEAVEAALRLLVLLPSSVDPVNMHGRWFIGSVRIAALTVAVVGLSRVVATVTGTPGHRHDRERVQAILERHGTSALAYFQLLDDKNWFFGADGQAFIGYVVKGRVAVALGEPVGPFDSCVAVAKEFAQWCQANGWTPAFHQATPEGVRALQAADFKALKLGEEAIVEVQSWSAEDKSYKSLRSAIRRCERGGYRTVELPSPLSDEDFAALQAVSDAWLHDGGHRERTFTLGRFDRDYLDDSVIVAIVDEADTVQAFANVLPSYQSTDATFDLMRRRPGSLNGVMEMLFVALIDRFKEQGYEGMNLGLAPLSGLDETPGAPARFMRTLYERGGAVFNFEGLRTFKNKWHPRWEPRFLAYQYDAALPRIAIAIGQAGELPDPKSWWSRAVRVARRFPVSCSFGLIQLWIALATEVHPEVHRELLQVMGLTWPEIAHLQWWRFLSAPLIQTHAGLTVFLAFAVLVVVPIAEWRLRSWRLPLVFVLGDFLSTVAIIIGLRFAEGLGNTHAARLITEPDGGSSVGIWSLVAACCASLPGRWRRITTAVLLAVLVGIAAIWHRLADCQHLTGVAIVLLLWWATDGFTKRPGRRFAGQGAEA